MITRAVYREDNEGYARSKTSVAHLDDPAPHNADEKVQPKQLTFGRFEEGKHCLVERRLADLFRIAACRRALLRAAEERALFDQRGGGNATKLNTIDMDIGGLSLSPDGNRSRSSRR